MQSINAPAARYFMLTLPLSTPAAAIVRWAAAVVAGAGFADAGTMNTPLQCGHWACWAVADAAATTVC